METQFTPIDLNSWARTQVYYYFSRMAPTGYSVTVNIDITEFKKTLVKQELKFFPAYLWAATKCFNNQIEFKCAEKDGVFGYYDKLTPLYSTFHDDTKTFSMMWTEFDDFLVFYQNYIKNKEAFGNSHGFLSQPETPPPENAYTISTIPWVEFSHFAVHSFENKPYYFPSVEAGKYHWEDNKLIMPLSITCHHATTDGWHIQKFLEEFKYTINYFERYI